MPHQCTTCGRTFPDGSKEMLSGCPDCGGNKFQFKPAGETTDDRPSPTGDTSSDSPTGDTSSDSPTGDTSSDTSRQPPAPDRQPGSVDDGGHDAEDGFVTRPPSAADSDRPEAQSPESRSPDAQTPESGTPDGQSPRSETPDTPTTDSEHVRDRSEEDVAQASARSDVVSPDELDRASREVDTDSSAAGEDPTTSADPEGSRPDIDDLRDELNEQFESIRIVSPGKYELNLMELYDRQEYIISLQEDGRYVIEMPDAWGIQDE